MPHDEMLAELDRRRAHASAMGGEKKLARRRERGVLNALERLNYLVDDGSFVETGLLGASGMFAEDVAKTPRDGKIAGFARIDGRDVAVCVNDFTVKGASTSATNSKKMGHIRRVATEKGFPFVHIGESTGARLPDTMGARGMGLLLGNDPTQFRRTRESPWAAAALDTSFGSSAWLCCVSDFAVMKKGSTMCVSSSRLVSMAIGEQVDLEALGGWRLHAESTGLIDRFVDTDEEAMDEIKRFLSYMPSHNMEAPPVAPVTADAAQDQRPILDVLPERRGRGRDRARGAPVRRRGEGRAPRTRARPPGTSVANPVDTPVITLQTDEGRIANAILDIIYRHARPDAVVMHLNLAAFVGRAGVDPMDNLIQAAVGIGRAYPGQAHFALVLRVDGSPELDDTKRRYCGLARDAGIPVFDELHEAARALAAVGHLEGALGRGYRAGSPHGRLDGPAACGHVETTPCLN